MRILYVTTVGSTMSFFKKLISELLEEGHTIDIATNQNEKPLPDDYMDYGCKIFNISCTRSPISKGTMKAIRELSRIVADGEYDIVHCHTPIASICTRLACKKYRKEGLKVIYTAHGFHFYKGAPIKNWIMYYPIEKICSYFTDTLITINQEDYELAKKKMKARRIEYVPGVGIDIQKFQDTNVNVNDKRRELGIPTDAFLLLSVGELNKNKNHEVVIKALAELKNKDVHYMIAGKGSLDGFLLDLAIKLGVEEQVHLLGFRTDVAELYKTADLFCFPSIREGLGLSAIEALASGLCVVASNNRGTREYIVDGENGYKNNYNDVNSFRENIDKFIDNTYKKNSTESINKFDYNSVNVEMSEIYDALYAK